MFVSPGCSPHVRGVAATSLTCPGCNLTGPGCNPSYPGCSPTAAACNPTTLQPCNRATLRAQAAARSPRSSTPAALAACRRCAPSRLTRRRRCSRPWPTPRQPSPRTSRRCSRGPRATSLCSRRGRRRGGTRLRRLAAPRRSPSCERSRRATSGSRTVQPVCNSGCPRCRRGHTSLAGNPPEGSTLACASRPERSPGRSGAPGRATPPAYAAHLRGTLTRLSR